MTEERLKEIKNSIDLQLEACKIFKQDNQLTLEELELYNEVVRLRNIAKEVKWILEYSVTTKEELLRIMNDITLEQLTGVDNE